MLKQLLTICAVAILANAASSAADLNLTAEHNKKLKAPITNIMETTQWSMFLQEFELFLNFGKCCQGNNPLNCALGVKAHAIEPIGYIETTMKPLYFPFANLDMGGNVSKKSFPWKRRSSNDNPATPRSKSYHAHFIYTPIMSLLFKKKMPIFCFHKGETSIPYISEFDPTWTNDFYFMKMIPQYLTFFTPQGLTSALIDCIATEAVNALTMTYAGTEGNISAFNSTYGNSTLTTYQSQLNTSNVSNNSTGSKDKRLVGKYTNALRTQMNRIRDTMYFVDGCYGFTTIGGYVDGADPILDATAIGHTIIAQLHTAGGVTGGAAFLEKQTNAIIGQTDNVTGAKITDTMCAAKPYPLPIASQYAFQLAYPTVGKTREMGASGMSVSTMKNLPAAKGAVFVVWQRRDYYAFAYNCGDSSSKSTK